MNRIVAINTVNYGSTGNIMVNIAEYARDHGYAYTTFAEDGHAQKKGVPGHEFIGSWQEIRISDFINTQTGNQGSLNILGTRKLLKRLDEIQPEIIHLHNLHSNFVNLELLFTYIKEKGISTVWTMQDCWSFTGHCPYFSIIGCEKWKTGCYECPLYREYPKARIDKSKELYEKKKRLFTGLPNNVLAAPTEWMKGLAAESFLKEYRAEVIPNFVDQTIFKPRESDFREKYHLQDKYLVLSVAFPFDQRKGADRLIRIADQLDDSYHIVIVGRTDITHPRITCIGRTTDQIELAKIYSACDLFVCASYLEAFGIVNIEALSCGLPVIVYKGSGGAEETIDSTCGILSDDQHDVADIRKIRESGLYTAEASLTFSRRFDKQVVLAQYVDLYRRMLEEKKGV